MVKIIYAEIDGSKWTIRYHGMTCNIRLPISSDVSFTALKKALCLRFPGYVVEFGNVFRQADHTNGNAASTYPIGNRNAEPVSSSRMVFERTW